MSDVLQTILFWAAPPLLGAVIGFVTNDIAIRMLFRPLAEKRIFGVRIPFTPGIIPKQRHALAESIGRMVSEQLLTEDTVRTQIESPRVREALKENIAGLTGSLLAVRLADLKTTRLPVFGSTVPELLHRLLSGLLKSSALLEALEGIIDGFLSTLSEKKVKEAVGEFGLETLLKEKIAALIDRDDFKEKLIRSVKEWVGGQREKNAELSVLVSDDLLDILTALFRSVFPYLHDALLQWLSNEEVRKNLEVKGKLLLDDIFSKLNIFQRFFVSVGQYDRTLGDNISAIIDDFIQRVSEAVRNDEDREAIIESFRSALDRWRKKGFREFLSEDEAKNEEKIDRVISGLFAFMRREKTGEKIAGAITDYIASRGEETLGSVVESVLGIGKADVTRFVIGYIKKDDFVETAADRITDFVLQFFAARGAWNLGELFGLDGKKKDSLDEQAVGALLVLLGQKIPEALRSLDIKALVENKINSLDMEDVEGLLLMVIAKQLKWINVFGAILGGLIGFLQILLRTLT